MFPVYLYSDDSDIAALPTEGNYFLIAKNGVYMHKDTNLVQSLVKVDLQDIPSLKILESKDIRVRLKLPKLDSKLLYRCLLFFRAVYNKYNSEANLNLFYHPDSNEYFLACPKQSVSHGSVHYGQNDNEELNYISEMKEKGYRRVGTIHSHCNFSAFHSGTDTADESVIDGVHITIGHVDSQRFSLATSLVVNNNRFKVEPINIIKGLTKEGKIVFAFSSNTADHYEVTLTEEEKEQIAQAYNEQIENEWLPKVEKLQYSYRKNKNKTKGYSKWWYENTVEKEDENEEETFTIITEKATASEETPKKTPRDWLYCVKRDALILRYNPDELLGDIGALYGTLRKFFQKQEITEEDIIFASEIKPENIAFYKAKGYLVYEA